MVVPWFQKEGKSTHRATDESPLYDRQMINEFHTIGPNPRYGRIGGGEESL
jgi:hypothetical protein